MNLLKEPPMHLNEPPNDQWERECRVRDGVSIDSAQYCITITGSMKVQDFVELVCRHMHSASLLYGEWLFGRDFDFRAVSYTAQHADMLLFSRRSELIRDVAPWIDGMEFEPLEPILRKRHEEEEKVRQSTPRDNPLVSPNSLLPPNPFVPPTHNVQLLQCTQDSKEFEKGRRQDEINRNTRFFGIAFLLGGALTLIILGSVCLSRRTTDNQCTVCGSCGGAIAMVVVGSTAVVGPLIVCGAIWIAYNCAKRIR